MSSLPCFCRQILFESYFRKKKSKYESKYYLKNHQESSRIEYKMEEVKALKTHKDNLLNHFTQFEDVLDLLRDPYGDALKIIKKRVKSDKWMKENKKHLGLLHPHLSGEHKNMQFKCTHVRDFTSPINYWASFEITCIDCNLLVKYRDYNVNPRLLNPKTPNLIDKVEEYVKNNADKREMLEKEYYNVLLYHYLCRPPQLCKHYLLPSNFRIESPLTYLR